MRIPILRTGEPISGAYISALERAIKSDGCSGVSELYHPCCVLHDLGYRHGIDPYGVKIDKAQTDANFRKCMQRRSRFGVLNPVAFYRWLGVRYFGWKPYAKDLETREPFETYFFYITPKQATE